MIASSALVETARRLMADGKGLLAIDESTGTCNQRFASAGIPQTEATRRAYREMLVSAPDLGRSISGAILFDETIRQRTQDGKPFVQLLEAASIMTGIKVDLGAKPLAGHAGEQVTEGLDGLRDRLKTYFEMGARFAKWRAVFKIDGASPGMACIAANAHALARYAALCQEAGLVPIVEPEVLMDGDHALQRCSDVTHRVLHGLFEQLDQQNVQLEAVILKAGMILPGSGCPVQDGTDAVAAATITCLLGSVPAAVAGIAFLSGGQPAELATARLNAMQVLCHTGAARRPWPLTFSFGRALQQPALAIWAAEGANRLAAQQALLLRAGCNRAAARGEYDASMETA